MPHFVNPPPEGPTSLEAKKPRAQAIVVTCMDVRVDPLGALGYQPGDAHVLRNAGGVVTDDVLRSIIVSQRLLGTTRVEVMGHTDCGAASPVSREVEAQLGRDLGSIDDVESAVRTSMARLHADPDVASDDVRGWVFDVSSGETKPVEP